MDWLVHNKETDYAILRINKEVAYRGKLTDMPDEFKEIVKEFKGDIFTALAISRENKNDRSI